MPTLQSMRSHQFPMNRIALQCKGTLLRFFFAISAKENNFSDFLLAFPDNGVYYPELQIRGGIEDNSKIIFLISQQKYML